MDDKKKRIDINDLPKAEAELTDEEAKGVTGGADGSVRFLSDTIQMTGHSIGANLTSGNTVGGALGSNTGNTVGGSLAGNISNPSKP